MHTLQLSVQVQPAQQAVSYTHLDVYKRQQCYHHDLHQGDPFAQLRDLGVSSLGIQYMLGIWDLLDRLDEEKKG